MQRHSQNVGGECFLSQQTMNLESCEKFRVVFLPIFSTWILKIDAFIAIPRVLRARWQK